MIISRTPLRVSLAGGGTDLKSYYSKRDYGQVISLGINKYIYVVIKKQSLLSDYKYKIRWSKSENCNSITEIKHPIIRETLEYFKVKDPLEISTFSDLPISSGLGSSSTFLVGFINALLAHQNIQQTKGYIADLAADIEINILKRVIGKQDHYAASYGGLNVITFFKKGNVNVEPVFYQKKILETLEKKLVLLFTNQTRNASKIIKNINFKEKFHELDYIREQVQKFRNIFEGKLKISNFGELLHNGWEFKKKLSPKSISNSKIDKIYNLALKNGATGGKICGAGGGGFLLLYSNDKKKLFNLLNKKNFLNFKFDNEGSRITYFDNRY
ncbi:MAG: GHMP kinase [Sphingomonadales bacterium]|nr:GHMP kinase [Sphingomonadales bacterium]